MTPAAWPPGDGEMARRLRAHDWSATPLGLVEGWSDRLRSVVEMILAMPGPATVLWGPAHVQIYNDAYITIARDRHPALLGRSVAEGWPDAYREVIAPLLDAAHGGRTTQLADFSVTLGQSDGSVEERVFDTTWLPMRDEAGTVAGVLQTLVEVSDRHRAEAALRASEQRYRALVTAMSYAVYSMGPDWTEMHRLDGHGFLADTKQPSGSWIDAYIALEDQQGVRAAIEEAIRTKGIFDLEHRVRRADSSMGWTRSRAVPLLDASGEIREWFGAASDVTARKTAEVALRESEERGTFLLHLADILRPLADPADIQAEACRLLGDRLEADRAYYVEVDEAAGVARVGRDHLRGEAVSLAGEHPLLAFAWILPHLRAGQPVVVPDTLVDARIPELNRPALAAVGIAAFADAPLVKQGRIVGALCVTAATPRAWSDTDVQLVAETGERIWAAVERTRAEAARRTSEVRLAAVFESLPIGIGVMADDGALILSNPAMQRFLPTGMIPSRDPARRARWRARYPDGRPAEPRDFPGARALRGERVVPGVEMLYRGDDEQEIWTSVSSSPIRNGEGKVTGGVVVVADTDAARRTVEALRDSEERFRQFGEASQDVLWIRDAGTLQWEYLTPAFEAIYGLDRVSALRGDSMANWVELILPEDRAQAVGSIQRVHDGEWVTFEYRVRRPVDGEIRWLRNTDFPIKDTTGRVARIGGVGHDITALKVTEEALAAAEQRQRLLLDGIPQLVWRAVDSGHWTWASPQWSEYTGQSDADSHGCGWLIPLHPDDRDAAQEAWKKAADAGSFGVECRIRRSGGGEYRWFQTRAAPVRNGGGAIVEWLGTSTDIHDLRELQGRQKVLVEELQHRTRNLITVVRSTADKTVRSSASLADFRVAFRDRLDALARVQGLLSRLEDNDRVTFDELIGAEMSALDGAAERVSLSGPLGVRLRSSMVQTLAMALHELATNAVKYGALGQQQGRLAVSWELEVDGPDGQRWLRIDWRESGVVMPVTGEKPTGSGQGRALIERALPYQLSAKTTYVLGPDGVHCTITIPTSASLSEGKEEHE